MELGFASALTLVFIAAKLFGAIAWSWPWFLAQPGARWSVA